MKRQVSGNADTARCESGGIQQTGMVWLSRAVFEVVRCGYLQSAVLRLALPSAQSRAVSCCSPGEKGSTGSDQEIQCLTRTLKSSGNPVIKKDKG